MIILKVTKISKVEKILAVVRGYPYPVKYMITKQTNPDQTALATARALSKLLPKLSLM